MSHIHKLIRFSNGEVIIGEVLEESLRYNQPTIQATNLFKVHQILSPDSYQMTTLIRYVQFTDDKYISIDKGDITFMTSVREDVIEYMEGYEDEDLDDESEIEKLATAGLFANATGGLVH